MKKKYLIGLFLVGFLVAPYWNVYECGGFELSFCAGWRFLAGITVLLVILISLTNLANFSLPELKFIAPPIFFGIVFSFLLVLTTQFVIKFMKERIKPSS